jgi:hypothetical protein
MASGKSGTGTPAAMQARISVTCTLLVPSKNSTNLNKQACIHNTQFQHQFFI